MGFLLISFFCFVILLSCQFGGKNMKNSRVVKNTVRAMALLISIMMLLSILFIPLRMFADETKDTSETAIYKVQNGANEVEFEESKDVTENVVISMEDGGFIAIKLDKEAAPITVANFQDLVKSGFYNGLIFHRVIDGFMIQGGDPLGIGIGGSDKKIKGEFEKNGVNNPIKHERGVISMARSQDPNSASSQFFICNGNDENLKHLDGSYAAFGHVIYGMQVVDKIAKVEKDSNDKPLKDVVMRKVFFIDDDVIDKLENISKDNSSAGSETATLNK